MESQPQNPEFRINPENFRPCIYFGYIDSADTDEMPCMGNLIRVCTIKTCNSRIPIGAV